MLIIKLFSYITSGGQKGLKIILLLILFNFTLHPFYISVSNIKYNTKNKKIEAEVKLFTNDFESTLKKATNNKIDLINGDKQENQKLITNYFYTNLNFKINSKKINYKVIGYEKEEEAIWVYVESDACTLTHQLLIENSLLHDFIKEQTNIMHFDVNGKKQSTKLVCPEKSYTFKF